MIVVGNVLEEMGIGLIYVIFKFLEFYGFKIDDIGLWEFNEVFVC